MRVAIVSGFLSVTVSFSCVVQAGCDSWKLVSTTETNRQEFPLPLPPDVIGEQFVAKDALVSCLKDLQVATVEASLINQESPSLTNPGKFPDSCQNLRHLTVYTNNHVCRMGATLRMLKVTFETVRRYKCQPSDIVSKQEVTGGERTELRCE